MSFPLSSKFRGVPMQDPVWQSFTSDPTLQGIALIFSLLSGVVILVQGARKVIGFAVKYKRESLGEKIEIIRRNLRDDLELCANDLHYFVARIAHFSMRIAMWALTVLIGFIGLATISKDAFENSPQVIIEFHTYAEFAKFSRIVYVLVIFTSAVFFFGNAARLGLAATYVRKTRKQQLKSK